jgi:hypothetical protein
MSEVVGWMSEQQARQTDDAASQKNVCELQDPLFRYVYLSHIYLAAALQSRAG